MARSSMRRALATGLCAAALAQPLVATKLSAQVPTPESYFGFRMGSDGELASAETIERYFEAAAARSTRVKVIDLGATTEGHRTIAAIVSSPENIRNLDQIRAANQRLADPRTLSPEEARRLAATHKAVLAIGGSIHAAEIGATQASNELLYSLATASDAETLEVLRNVVLILIPSLNPDGHRLVVDWYRKTKGTPYEGGPMPWQYHKYAGHDLNRDAFMMNMAESRNLARFFYREWHPQVFLSMHQMGGNGPRMFVPPVVDPIDRNYDPILWREAALLGGAMALELQRDGRAGVVSNALYDYYWPGYEDSAPLGHNTVCLLTEVAGVKVAAPTYVAATDLRDQTGAWTNAPQINFPDPWPGGRWTLRDIVDYDLSAVHGLLHAVALYRERLVQSFYDMGRRAIEQGQRAGPFGFVIPPDQFDPHAVARLEEVLLQGGIEIHRATESFQADGTFYPAGSDLVLLAQPYRAYVKTLLERQDYPVRRASAGAPPERPYDVAGWTLPAQMGVDVRTIQRSFETPGLLRITNAAVAPVQVSGDRAPDYYVIDARGNGGALAVNRLMSAGVAVSWLTSELDADGYRYTAGSLVVARSDIVRPIVERIAAELGLRTTGLKGKLPSGLRLLGTVRVALYKPWMENVDEGWTRWLLEEYQFHFTSINDAEIGAGNLRKRYDAIILPSASAEQLRYGNPAGVVPPEYVGGLAEAGLAALRNFVQAGGTLICLDQAGGLAIEAFKLPLRDVAHEIGNDELFCPGSILRIELDPGHPLSYGMSPHTAGFFAFSSAYDIVGAPNAETQDRKSAGSRVRTVARYASENLLVSGWIEGESTIAGRPAAVEISLGQGRVMLLGFPVQHRGQSHATFRLLFNSIFTSR
jgi:hypothetical protein